MKIDFIIFIGLVFQVALVLMISHGLLLFHPADECGTLQKPLGTSIHCVERILRTENESAFEVTVPQAAKAGLSAQKEPRAIQATEAGCIAVKQGRDTVCQQYRAFDLEARLDPPFEVVTYAWQFKVPADRADRMATNAVTVPPSKLSPKERNAL